MSKEELLDKIEYLYGKNDYERLIKACDEVLEIDADEPAALNYKAIALHFLERYDEALELLDYNLKLHPKNPYTLNNKALVFIALGKYSEALKLCEEGLKYKDFDWLEINKIEALIHLGREKEAFEFFKSIDIPYYTFEEALSNCGKIEGDDIFRRLDRLLGEEKYDEVLRICDEREYTERLVDYKIISLLHLDRYDEAMEFLDKAIEDYQHNYNFCLVKAMISKNLDEAIDSYERAFEILGSVSNYRLYVNRYVECLKIKSHYLIENEKYSDAINVLEKIGVYRPQSAEI